MKGYVVLALSTKQKISVSNCHPPLEQEITMCFADGMIGCLPVFDSMEAAEKYANGNQIFEIEGVNK